MSGLLWARFDRYEIRDGLIRPVAGAKFEKYDPWLDFRSPRGKESVVQPYHFLFKLVDRFDHTEGGSSKAEQLVTKWCSEHGLVGVLQETCIAAYVAPDGEEPRSYWRFPGGWRGLSRWPDSIKIAGPCALVRSVGDYEWHIKGLETSWAPFFPKARGEPVQGAFPLPFTDEFWGSYAEPLDRFLDTARRLRDAVANLQSLAERTELDEQQMALWMRAGASLQWFLSNSNHGVYPDLRDTFNVRLGFSYASLLSAYAAMAVQDLAHARQMICAKCHTPFVSLAKRARYCSSQCRKAMQMRRFREKRKGLKERSGQDA